MIRYGCDVEENEEVAKCMSVTKRRSMKVKRKFKEVDWEKYQL